MKRFLLLTVLGGLAMPAGAAAATVSRGAVLSVNARQHTIQVVDAHHQVDRYRYAGRLPRLHTGSRIGFARAGQAISHVRSLAGASRSVSYYARVVRSSSHGVELRLADGNTVSFSSGQISPHRARHRQVLAHADSIAIAHPRPIVDIQGLQPGAVVLISESVDPLGDVTITITLRAGGQQQGSASQQEQQGSDQQGDDTGKQDSQDAVGTITDVSPTAITVSTQDNGPMSFTVDDPTVTEGYSAGDLVDVSYSPNADGSLDATDVEYVEQDAVGAVTAVAPGLVTLTDSTTGVPETFTADPALLLFDGVSVGDQIDVSYHQSAGQPVVDAVDDLTVDGLGGQG